MANYTNGAQIASSPIPTHLELELIDLVVNHSVTLDGVSLSFPDIVGKLKLEFSPILKQRTEQLDPNLLRTRLQKLQAEDATLSKEIHTLLDKISKMQDAIFAAGGNPYKDANVESNRRRLEPLYNKQNNLRASINRISNLLNSGGSMVEVSPCVLGEFIPGVEPTIVLYYNNISQTGIHGRYQKLIGVLVHEMMHAWYYFMADEQGRSVLAVDEPMVEFSALFFIEHLANEASNSQHKLSTYIAEVLDKMRRMVRDKQCLTGDTAAYGYGYYLYENLGKNRGLWIEEYSKRSSAISPTDQDVLDFQHALIPCYPFNEERKLQKVLERIIFGRSTALPKKISKGGGAKISIPSSGSARTTVAYANTKSDPICKWRTASVQTVVELVSLLPKTQMPKAAFRGYMSRAYSGAYFRTPYQLALQLGLYYEDDKEYIPRFDHNITIAEATAYMHKWMERYYVPNPFTKKGFIGVVPSINLLNALVDYLQSNPGKPNLAAAGVALFGGEMGNIGSVKYVLNNYSKIIEVDKEYNMNLLLHRSGPIKVYNRRDDKKAFFDHFK